MIRLPVQYGPHDHTRVRAGTDVLVVDVLWENVYTIHDEASEVI